MTALKISLPLILIFLAACRTLDPQARAVTLLDRAPTNCKNLGPVNVDWTWWGDTTEALNALKNHTAEQGGNALLLQSAAIGIAYNCPTTAAEPN